MIRLDDHPADTYSSVGMVTKPCCLFPSLHVSLCLSCSLVLLFPFPLAHSHIKRCNNTCQPLKTALANHYMGKKYSTLTISCHHKSHVMCNVSPSLCYCRFASERTNTWKTNSEHGNVGKPLSYLDKYVYR